MPSSATCRHLARNLIFCAPTGPCRAGPRFPSSPSPSPSPSPRGGAGLGPARHGTTALHFPLVSSHLVLFRLVSFCFVSSPFVSSRLVSCRSIECRRFELPHPFHPYRLTEWFHWLRNDFGTALVFCPVIYRHNIDMESAPAAASAAAVTPASGPLPVSAAAGLGDADARLASPVPSLPPWEQHGGVIHMPRYLYSSLAAPLLHRSGFFVTCAFQREKSATKEALEILRECLSGIVSHDRVDDEPDAKRARTGAYSREMEQNRSDVPRGQQVLVTNAEEEDIGAGDGQSPRDEPHGADLDDATRNALGVENSSPGGDSARGEIGSATTRTSDAAIKQDDFHLVKLARNGMVYISIPRRPPGYLVSFFASILKDFHSRSRGAPRWCHRIFPVQATCLWTQGEVRSTVVALVKDFLEDRNISSNNPLKYAVAVNRRGFEEKQKTNEAGTSPVPFGKLECIHAVAEAIQTLTPYISVDLTNPEMVVILELLPLVRVETSVCAVSVLPRELVATKPKLVIQALAPAKKPNKKTSKGES